GFRRGRVNAGMRDQTKIYESAGAWAKEIALHLCGKMSGRPGKGRSRAPDFRFRLNPTCASKKSPRRTRLTRAHTSTLHAAVTTRWRSRKKLVTCYCQLCELIGGTREVVALPSHH